MGDDRRTQVLCELVGFLHLSKVAAADAMRDASHLTQHPQMVAVIWKLAKLRAEILQRWEIWDRMQEIAIFPADASKIH